MSISKDTAWPHAISGALRPSERPLSPPRANRRPALFWLLSCAVHLLLLGLGWGLLFSRDPSPMPMTTAIKVSVAVDDEPSTPPAVYETVTAAPSRQPPARRLTSPEVTLPTLVAVHDPIPVVPPPAQGPDRPAPQRTIRAAAPPPAPPDHLDPIVSAEAVRAPSPPPAGPRAVLPERSRPAFSASQPDVSAPATVVAAGSIPAPSLGPATRELPGQTSLPRRSDHLPMLAVPAAPPGQQPPIATASPAPSSAGEPQQANPTSIRSARYLHNPAPAYPSEARRRGWEGMVLLLIEIREDGRPGQVSIKQSSGYRMLDQAAVGAVRRWTFLPAQREGKPITSLAEVPIVFSLRHER